jgi:hypothetical protein
MRRWISDEQPGWISTTARVPAWLFAAAAKTPALHSPAIRASSRAFPAGRDGIAPGYACISALEMRPMTVVGGDKP